MHIGYNLTPINDRQTRYFRIIYEETMMVSLIWATFIIYLRIFTILLWSCYLFFTCFEELSKRTTMPTGCKDEPWQFERTYISFRMQISCWVRRKEGEIRLGQKFNDLYLNTPTLGGRAPIVQVYRTQIFKIINLDEIPMLKNIIILHDIRFLVLTLSIRLRSSLLVQIKINLNYY